MTSSHALRQTLTRRHRWLPLAAVLIALIGFVGSRPVAAAPLSETGAGTFTAPGRSFVFSGQVTGTPVTGTIAGTETNSGLQNPQTGCFASTVNLTLTDAAGNTLTKSETGSLCPVFSNGSPDSPRTTRFTGDYTITGGTGIYAGATGSGTSTIDFVFGFPANTFTSTETGTFFLPMALLPQSKDDCKGGGWRRYGIFKNQGDCVSFVATNGRNQPAGTP